MKLLLISVTWHMPHDRVSDTIIHVILKYHKRRSDQGHEKIWLIIFHDHGPQCRLDHTHDEKKCTSYFKSLRHKTYCKADNGPHFFGWDNNLFECKWENQQPITSMPLWVINLLTYSSLLSNFINYVHSRHVYTSDEGPWENMVHDLSWS
jgi:hypothetical protein